MIYQLEASSDGKSAKYKGSYTEIQLQGAGETFATGKWYVFGVLSLIPSDDSRTLDANTEFKGSQDLTTWVDVDTDEETLKIDVPLIFPWTKVVTSSKTKSDGTIVGYGQASKLQIKPAGTLIKVHATSSLYERVKLLGIKLRGHGLGFTGKFAPSNLDTLALSIPCPPNL